MNSSIHKAIAFHLKPVKRLSQYELSRRLYSRLNESAISLIAEVDRYHGVNVDLLQLPLSIEENVFKRSLEDSLKVWRENSHTAVWLRVPINHSRLIPIAHEHGFIFHHAENDFSMLKLWLIASSEDMLPRFATHQVGVAGAVIREDTKEVLVIQDKNVNRPMWKLPGGVSDLGEDIADTAVREVFEETGIHSEFRSVLAFRQQHLQPGAFGRSDIYVVCRMKPTTFDINPCHREILKCQWMSPSCLSESTSTPITKRLVALIMLGLKEGFEHVDMTQEKMKSIHKGLTYYLFHRPLPLR